MTYVTRYALRLFDADLEEDNLTREDLRASKTLRDWYVNSWNECEESRRIEPSWIDNLYKFDLLDWFESHPTHPLTRDVLRGESNNIWEELDCRYTEKELCDFVASDSSVATDLLEDSLIHVNGKYFFNKSYL